MLRDNKEPRRESFIERIREGLREDLDKKLKTDSLKADNLKESVEIEGISMEPCFCYVVESKVGSSFNLCYHVKISDGAIPSLLMNELNDTSLKGKEDVWYQEHVFPLDVDIAYNKDAFGENDLIGFLSEEEGLAASCLRILFADKVECVYFNVSKPDLYESLGNESIKDKVNSLDIEADDKFFRVEMIQ